VSAKPKVEGKQKMYFTLVAKANFGIRVDYLMLVKQQVARIGINLDVIGLDWATMVGELIAFRNFDLCYIALTGGGADPDFTGVYDENGSLNLFGYHTDMDYDDALGTGTNEWYMRQGNLIMPPNSEERVAHYWEWEQYLMDKILPCQPTFTPKAYTATWGNLNGYNISDGLLQSWGKMSWTGTHAGQASTNEIVIGDAPWSDLNPLFQDDTSSRFISGATMDPLIWYDADNSAWPHLAKSWTHINDTYVRITLREDIKWQVDPDGNFTDEYFDAEDVYFTFFAWSHSSGDCQGICEWLEEMVVVDKYTIDLYIDADSGTPENEPYAPYLPDISLKMLPEHYLNQTQDVGGWPDSTHVSWDTFATHCFGTGLFEIDTLTESVEAILTVNPDCWRLNSTLTNDPDLNWNERFGDFSGGLNQLRIRQLDSNTEFAEFEFGGVDITDITSNPSKRELFEADPDISIQSAIMYYFGFIGYNMRPTRPVIGNPDPWDIDPSITKGLAVRKAISYAIDREEINQLLHGGEYTLTDHPIYAAMGVWCNPDIIKYNHDLAKALAYIEPWGSYTSIVIGTNYYPLFILSEVFLCMVFLFKKKK
ncbi:MAG: ABC transporter substrate-binding protein, partial [Candidatus Heimdallarchaeota archaeon]